MKFNEFDENGWTPAEIEKNDRFFDLGERILTGLTIAFGFLLGLIVSHTLTNFL